jgi:hypothetical protein
MFLCLLLVTSFPLLLSSADALELPPGPSSTTTSLTPSPRTTQDNPITPVPTYALATFDERLSSLSAARTAHPGCTFIKDVPRPPPEALTDTSFERVRNSPAPIETTAKTSHESRKRCSTVTAVTVYRHLTTQSTIISMAPARAAWGRRTRPVEPTVFEA